MQRRDHLGRDCPLPLDARRVGGDQRRERARPRDAIARRLALRGAASVEDTRSASLVRLWPALWRIRPVGQWRVRGERKHPIATAPHVCDNPSPAQVRSAPRMQWVNSRSVKACPVSRTRGCSRAAAATLATWRCPAWRSATCCVRRTPTHASGRSTRSRPRRRPACWRCSPAPTGRLPAGRPAGPRRLAAQRRRVQAALPGARQGQGALGRRLRRFRGGGDHPPGARRRRADRDRLRAAAGDCLDRGGDRQGRAAGVGRLRRKYWASCSCSATRPRPTPPSPRPTTWSSTAS